MITVGATQDTSPMSSEPPLSGFAAGASSFFTVRGSPSSLPSARRRRADQLARHLGVGHRCGSVGDLVADLVVLLDVLEIHLAEEVPDRGERRNHVGLVAAIGDHVMRALLRTELLAAEIPADVHELDRAQRVAAAPGPRRRVRGLALESVFDRDQPGPVRLAPGGRELVADMGEEHGVDVLEHAGAHEEGLAADELLGNARPDHERAGKLLALHEVLDRERRDDVDRLSGIVALAVSWSPFYERLAIGDARLLRGLR